MQQIALFHSNSPPSALVEEICAAHEVMTVIEKSARTRVLQLKEHLQTQDRDHLRNLCIAHQTDIGFLPPHFGDKEIKVLAMDMDSTLINIECIDEIADAVGKKKEVSEITEAAMRGEIKDFQESLRRRVALLEGVPESALTEVYTQRLQFNPGAKELIQRAKNRGIHTLLVSGGFTYFTDRLQHVLGIDEAHANQLEITNGFLTGRVLGPIVDGQAKADYVVASCLRFGKDKSHSVTMGDGSNDLTMMIGSGLSIGFRAKPIVKQKADIAFDHVSLDCWLDLIA